MLSSAVNHRRDTPGPSLGVHAVLILLALNNGCRLKKKKKWLEAIHLLVALYGDNNSPKDIFEKDPLCLRQGK